MEMDENQVNSVSKMILTLLLAFSICCRYSAKKHCIPQIESRILDAAWSVIHISFVRSFFSRWSKYPNKAIKLLLPYFFEN
jgi:hypothetical protein